MASPNYPSSSYYFVNSTQTARYPQLDVRNERTPIIILDVQPKPQLSDGASVTFAICYILCILGFVLGVIFIATRK